MRSDEGFARVMSTEYAQRFKTRERDRRDRPSVVRVRRLRNSVDQPAADIRTIEASALTGHEAFDVDPVLPTIEEKLEDRHVFGGKDANGAPHEGKGARAVGLEGVRQSPSDRRRIELLSAHEPLRALNQRITPA